MTGTNKIPHPQRKNAESARRYAENRKANNAARPKQVFNESDKSWSRREQSPTL